MTHADRIVLFIALGYIAAMLWRIYKAVDR
jgi:hypothetical protein